MFFIYKKIGTEWKNVFDEELCGAADTYENAQRVVDALEEIDPTGGHREIRNESDEVIAPQKYYILKLERHELGFVCSRDIVGIADTLANARQLYKEMAGAPTSKNFEIVDAEWNVVE